jgi:thioredoxin-like negative regulator of GroEL
VSLFASLLTLAGCNGGVHWEGPTFQDAQALGRNRNRPIFVYFRSWYLVECTQFEEQVLKNPEILAETRGMVCVPLDFDRDRPLAQQWGIKTVPAFVIVAPGGQVLARQEARITQPELLSAVRAAKAAFAASTQPIERGPPIIP